MPPNTTEDTESQHGSSHLAEKNTESKITFHVRNMRERDLPDVMKLRREMNVHDVQSVLETWLKLDPDGMFVVVNESEEIIGCCSNIQNNPDLYVGGTYCITKKYRNYAVGSKMASQGYARAGDKNIAGNSVLTMASKYKAKGGFPFVDDKFVTLKNSSTVPLSPASLSNEAPEGVSIELYHERHLQSIVSYDTAIVYFSREHLLRLSCQERDTKTFVALRNGICVGYGTIKRSCLNAGRVGPLYADDPQIAEALLKTLIESFPGVSGFAMNTVSTNAAANELMKKLGCTSIEKCIRIYKTGLVDADLSKIYAQFDCNFTTF